MTRCSDPQAIRYGKSPLVTMAGQIGVSLPNQGQQNHAMEVLESSFSRDTPGFSQGAPAFLMGVANYPNGASRRVRVIALARDGVYKSIWQRRDHFGKFKRAEILPSHPAYIRLRDDADTDGLIQALLRDGEI